MEKKKSIVLLIGRIAGIFLFLLTCRTYSIRILESTPIHPGNYIKAREEFSSKKIQPKAKLQYSKSVVPSGAKEVYYQSGNLQLSAWLSETPNDDIKHPAVVYAHGGFSKDHRDWQDLKPFIEAGFIVLYPSWRSEDGNAGDFEFLYGEVEDAIAAGKYLADLPYVDSNSIYICGHSIGASITLFSAMLPSPFKKAAAMEPNIKTSYLIGDFEYFVAFDVENPKEVGIRSPLSYAESLQIPLLILHGKHDYGSRGKVFFEKARKAGLDVDYKIIFGDHFTVVREGIPTAIQYFLGTAKLVNP